MLNKIIKYILLSVAGLLMLGSQAMAQLTIAVPDTTIDRFGSYLIPIKFEIQKPLNGIDLSFQLRFNDSIISIKSAQGGGQYAIKSQLPPLTYEYPKNSEAYTRVIASGVTLDGSGILCMLEIRGLVFSDSIAYITPDSVLINGNLYTGAVLQRGKIKVIGLPFSIKIPDAIGHNYPNPFPTYANETRFDFSIESETKISFVVYNTYGRMVLTSEDNDGTFTVLSLDDSKSFNNLDGDFSRGNYILVLSPNSWIFSGGPYYLVMKTSRGTSITNFLYLK